MQKSELLYVGSYEGKDSRCLSVFDYENQKMLESHEIKNSAYLCFSPDRQYLYTVIESASHKNLEGGGVAAYAVEDGGKLHFINDGFTEGASPCHLSVSADAKTLYAANYTGGSTIAFELLEGGRIGEKKFFINHNELGAASHAVGSRQKSAHAHYIQPLSINGLLTIWSCDLGLDAVLVFDETGKEMTRFQTPAGFGPRHMVFHPDYPLVYVLGELACAVINLEYSYDKSLHIKACGEMSVLKSKSDAECTCAAIRVSPCGKFVLTSNRMAGTEGSLSIFSLDASGMVVALENVVPSGGIWPRDFNFNKKGDVVFVANQESDKVSLFDWSQNGKLVPTGKALDVQKPACVLL